MFLSHSAHANTVETGKSQKYLKFEKHSGCQFLQKNFMGQSLLPQLKNSVWLTLMKLTPQ